MVREDRLPPKGPTSNFPCGFANILLNPDVILGLLSGRWEWFDHPILIQPTH